MKPYKPVQVVLEITKQCNLCCRHCGSACNKKLDFRELATCEWLDVIDQLADLGTEKVVFSGGEPTMKKDLDKIIEHTAKKGIRYGIITNGYSIPKKVYSAMKTYKPFAIGVSLDGNEAIHNLIRKKPDSWERVFKTIEKLKKMGIQICAVTTVSKWNLSVLDELAEIMSKNVDSWQIQLAFPFGRMKDESDSILSEDDFIHLCRQIAIYKALYSDLNIQAADCFCSSPDGLIRTGNYNGCGAGIDSMAIDSLGRILSCLSLRDGKSEGKIRHTFIKDYWNDPKCFTMNRKFKSNMAIGGKCENCDMLKKCRGGCASMSYSCTGKFHQAPFCVYRSFDQIMGGGENK